MTLDNIKEEIDKAGTIVIVTHENPDGDAIGSSLAMYIMLKNIGKQVEVIIPEIPKTFNYLPYINEVKTKGSIEKHDLAISVDCSDIKRLNGFSEYFENAKKTISIDHHSSNTMFGDINYVNPVAPATAQILVSMFQYWKIEITKEIGTCLITGIITDTGGFKYATVTHETFDFASWLLQNGIHISQIYENCMQVISKSRFELTKIAVDRLEFVEDGKIAFTYINKEDEKLVNADIGDHEGIVEQGRSVEGVEVSIFLRETDKGYKVSCRSTNDVNVVDICSIFGGGGHARAAGCTLPYSLDIARDKIISETKKHL
ncbi:MAG: bifunctional oligoribonuclease/PAP phosphatase NrnA [Oscillospiraceae bacterium]|nr:bifunctional oligoribonuclease/PAP phosphatase NrnA [Oscillospiraceae bacterium]